MSVHMVAAKNTAVAHVGSLYCKVLGLCVRSLAMAIGGLKVCCSFLPGLM